MVGVVWSVRSARVVWNILCKIVEGRLEAFMV